MQSQRIKCKAKSKRSQKRCENWAVKGRETCRMHGGTTKVGPLSANFKTGRFSKYLPQRFADLFDAVSAGDVLDLTHDINVLSSRIADVLQRVDSGESGQLWALTQKAFAELKRAQKSGRKKDLTEAVAALGELLTKGGTDQAAWAEVKELFAQRAKLVESQRKRAIETKQMMSTDEVLGMMRYLVESVKKHVRDPEALSNISADFARFSGEGYRRMASARSH